jgi:hypothetical protein
MKKTTASLLVAGGLALSMGAQAASVTESFSVGPLTTELETATATGVFNQFDAALGTLNSITIDLAYQSISTTSLENTAAQGQRFSWQSDLDWEFEILAGSGNFVTADPTLLGTTGGRISLASGATLDLGTTTDNGTLSLTISGADLASYIGAGTAGIGCNTFTTSTFSGGGGNVASAQTTTASCSGDITYDFDGVTVPVPEPAAVWLIGAGLLGFAGFRAKK